jgi:hypothetical protein
MFGNALRRLALQLRLHGKSVHFERRNEGRITVLTSERVRIVPPTRGPTNPEISKETYRDFQFDMSGWEA